MAAINFVAPACTFLILNYLCHFAPTRSEYYYDTSPNVNNVIISASLTPLKLGSAIFVKDLYNNYSAILKSNRSTSRHTGSLNLFTCTLILLSGDNQ